MRCLVCQCGTSVLQTRDGKRQRECSQGHRQWTVEVPEVVLNHLGAKLHDLLAQAERGALKRHNVEQAKVRIKEAIFEGLSNAKVAAKLGVSKTTVQRIRKTLPKSIE